MKISLSLLRRMSVGRQLALAFGVVLCLTGALGTRFAVCAARGACARLELDDKWLEGVGQLADLRTALVEARELEIKHSRSTDRSYHAEYEEKLAAAMAAIDQALASYKGKVASDGERERFAVTKSCRPTRRPPRRWWRWAATRSSRMPPTSATAWAARPTTRHWSRSRP
jgi:hypothetical protein